MEKTKSSIYLIIVNLIPIIGVSYWGWSLYDILICYWLETIIMGFYNIFKIANAQGKGTTLPKQYQLINADSKKSSIIIFFMFHFGIYIIGLGVLIFWIFDFKKYFPHSSLNLFSLLIMSVSFMISHGISYWQNYIGNGEYKRISPHDAMYLPYRRVMVLAATLGFGLFLSSFTRGFFAINLDVMGPIMLIIIKSVFDLQYHSYSHQELMIAVNRD